MSTLNYKKLKKEELIDEVLKRENLLSVLEDRNKVTAKKLQEAVEEKDKLKKDNEHLNDVINDLKISNNMIKANKEVEIDKFKKNLDKVNKDLITSNELVESFKEEIDNKFSKICELEENNKFYKNAYTKTLSSSKYLIACAIVFAIVAIIEAIIITL